MSLFCIYSLDTANHSDISISGNLSMNYFLHKTSITGRISFKSYGIAVSIVGIIILNEWFMIIYDIYIKTVMLNHTL